MSSFLIFKNLALFRFAILTSKCVGWFVIVGVNFIIDKHWNLWNKDLYHFPINMMFPLFIILIISHCEDLNQHCTTLSLSHRIDITCVTKIKQLLAAFN